MDNFPVHASDFLQMPYGIPVLTYSDGSSKYIVALSWEGMADSFTLSISSPSATSVNTSYVVIYKEPVREVVG